MCACASCGIDPFPGLESCQTSDGESTSGHFVQCDSTFDATANDGTVTRFAEPAWLRIHTEGSSRRWLCAAPDEACVEAANGRGAAHRYMNILRNALRRTARVAGALLLVSPLAWLVEQRAAHAYRPFDGTDGDVADTGEFELELGPLHYAQEGDEKFFLTPTVLNLGIV